MSSPARRSAASLRAVPPRPAAALSHGLCFDPDAACAHLAACDPILADLIARVGPFTLRPPRTLSLFGALLRSIVYQQLSGKAAATIHERVLALFAGRAPAAAQLLALSDEQLRAAGLSRNKIAAVRDLARHTLEGTVPTVARARRMTDEELIERLTLVRGVGRWTVEMLLIFRLGRPDVLPVSDLGVRKGFARAYGMRRLPSPRTLERRAARWRPYRTVASWYLWRAVELP